MATNKTRAHNLSNPSRPLDINTWARPDTGVVKCNCDATLFKREGYTGMGCVLRDSQGEFMWCHSVKILGVLSSKEAKVYVLCQAIIWVMRLEIPSVVFKLDAKTVVNAFYSTSEDNLEFGIALCSSCLTHVGIGRGQRQFITL